MSNFEKSSCISFGASGGGGSESGLPINLYPMRNHREINESAWGVSKTDRRAKNSKVSPMTDSKGGRR